MARQHLSLLKRSGNRAPIGGDRGQAGGGGEKRQRKEKEQHQRAVADQGEAAPLEGKMYVAESSHDYDWIPDPSATIKVLTSFRMSAALWSTISDCDEVYNYWEPLHLLLYGDGFQTWEYSPLYAIRSYLYIWLHYVPANAFRWLLPSSKVTVFVIMRSVICMLSIYAEFSLFKAICCRLSNSIGRLYLVFTMLSTGMFVACAAFLPSTFSMTLHTLAVAAYLREQWLTAILCTAVSALVGWPFAALLGLPIAIEMLLLRGRALGGKFVFYSLLSGLCTVGSLYSVDSYYYGKTVLAPLNIVLYNVFSSHGPDLYGIEPLSFYIKNLFLNWNVLLLVAPLALPLAVAHFVRLCPPALAAENKGCRMVLGVPLSMDYWRRPLPVVLLTLSLLAWCGVFFTQPHKEERFLFPIYPLIALLAAVAIDALQRLLPWRNVSFGLATAVVVLFMCVSFMRTFSLYRNFTGQADVYRSLNDHLFSATEQFDFSQRNDPVRVCVGKEWYRFPSSFFLPDDVEDKFGRKRRTQLSFLQSEFRGQLPKQWQQGKIPDITKAIPTHMNDQNLEEPSRYVDLDSCDFVIDLDTGVYTQREPNYAAMRDKLRVVSSHPYLLAGQSHQLLRAFYVPYVSEQHCTYGHYQLLERIVPTKR